MLDRLPRSLQQQPMLRVDQHRLPLRQPEKRRVETRDVVDETGPAADDLAGRVRVGVVVLLDIPPVLPRLGYRIAALAQDLPEFLRVGGTRNAQRVADYRKPLVDPR